MDLENFAGLLGGKVRARVMLLKREVFDAIIPSDEYRDSQKKVIRQMAVKYQTR